MTGRRSDTRARLARRRRWRVSAPFFVNQSESRHTGGREMKRRRVRALEGETSMPTDTATAVRRQPVAMNGVDTPTLFATIDVVKGTPSLARFQFRARNEWLSGTHSRTTIDSFSGAGGEQAHSSVFRVDADHPTVLVGKDQGPLPVEFLLHALASCITA